MTHTPIPWELSDNEIIACNGEVRILDLIGAMGGEDANANADFIIKAVNCHDELLATCERLLEYTKNSLLDRYSEPNDCAFYKKAKRTINKAKRKPVSV